MRIVLNAAACALCVVAIVVNGVYLAAMLGLI
jgi:hypothetical protein